MEKIKLKIQGDFVGKKIDDIDKNLNYRIVEQDGEHYIVTMDYQPHRYNFVVNNGVITKQSMG